MAKRRRPRNAPIQQSTQKITPVTSIAQRSNLGKNGSSSASAAASIGLIGSLAEPQILVEGGSDTHMVFATSGRPVVNRRLVLDDTLGQATPKILGNNRSALKGMKLEFIARTLKNGTPTICLNGDELEVENAKWRYAVILYLIGENPMINYLNTFFMK